MAKRWRSVEAKPGELVARFGRDPDNGLDLLYAWGAAGAGKPDARVLCSALEEAVVFDGKPLRKVLEAASRARPRDISDLGKDGDGPLEVVKGVVR